MASPVNVGHEHSRANDVRQVGTEVLQGGTNDLEASFRLGVGVAGRVRAAALFDRCTASNINVVTRTHGTTIAGFFFLFGSGESALKGDDSQLSDAGPSNG